MSYIFAMSDMHEELDLFKEMLNLVDLSGDNQLVLIGDYIDIHTQDLSILYFIKELQDKYKDNVIILAGNHEFMLLEDIQSKAGSITDPVIINWLKGLPYYYETPTQIFVHAGVDEEAEELWKWGSEDYYFCSKYPHSTGKFYKDIIAGHISTSEIGGNVYSGKVYWDRASHFYIDGCTRKTGSIPVLKYNTLSGRYSSFEKDNQDDGSFSWREYFLTPSSRKR